MLIRSVHLENFKSYEQATIKFLEGTNAIVGRNGAGKSSLVEAIGYALFDYTSASRQGDLLREGASSGRVVVRFLSSLDEREYEVERAFGKNGTTRHRILDCENDRIVLAESVTEVRQWLREHLGIEREASTDDLFRNTIGVPQGSFTAPFLLAAGERKRIFDPLLQVDEYERAFQNLRETVRYLSDQLASLEQEIARLEGQLEQLPRHRQELQEVTAAIVALTAEAQSVDADLRTARAALRELDQAEQAVRRAEQAHAEAAYQVQAAQAKHRQAQEALDEAARARQQVADAEPGYRAYLAAEERLRSLEAQREERDRIQRARQQASVEHASLAAQQSQVRQALEQIAQAAARLETVRPQAEKQARLANEHEKARLQAQLLPDARRLADDARAALAEAQARLERTIARLQQAVAQEAELAQLDAHLESLAEQERQLQAQRSAMQSEMARMHEQSEALSKGEGARCPTCEAELTPAHRQELLARNRARTEELRARLAEADRALKAVAQQRAQHQSRRAELERALRGAPTDEDRQEQERQIERSAQALQEQEDRIAQLTVWAERAQSLAKQLEALGDPLAEARLLEAQIAARDQRQQELDDLDRAVAELDAKLARLQHELAQYEHLDETLQEARRTLEQHRPQHDAYLTRIETARQFEARQQRLNQAAEALQALAQQQAVAAQALASAQAHYDASRHAAARQRVEALSSEATRIRTELASRQERSDALTQDIRRLEELQSALQERLAARDETLDLQSLLEEMRTLLHQAGPYITQQLVARISHQASEFYCDIMNDYSGRLTWSEDYDLTLEIAGRHRGFQQLSGGEQMSAALALRLALLRHLSNIDVAFFDEPTAHLDPERRDGLAEKIMQVKGFSQLFVISHDDTFERAAQSYLRVVKEDGVSRVEAV